MPPPPPPATTRTMSPPTRRPGDRDQMYNPRQSDASLPYRSDKDDTVTIQKPNGSETTFKLPPTNLKDLPLRPAPNGTSDPKRRPSDPAYRPGEREREPQPQRRASSPAPGTIPPAPVSPTSKPSYVPGHSPPGSRNPSYGNYNPPAAGSSNDTDKKGMPGGFPTGGRMKPLLPEDPLDPRSPSFARRPPPGPAPINGGINGDHNGSLNAIGGGSNRRPEVVESMPGPAASLPSNKDDRDRTGPSGPYNPRFGPERPPSPGYTKPIRPPPPRNSSSAGNSDYGVPSSNKPNGNGTTISNPYPSNPNPSNPSRPSIGPGRHGSIIEMMPGPAAHSPPPPPHGGYGPGPSHGHGHPSLGLALGPKPHSSLSKPSKTAAKLSELEEGLLYGDTEQYPPQMELGDYRQATECSLREYMALQRKRRQISYKIAAGNTGKEAVLIEEKLRHQASTAIDELIELRGRVAEIVRRGEKERWRRYLWSGAFAIFIPLVKSFFRPSSVDKGAHARDHRPRNRTEYAFRKSKSLINRILSQARRPGLASLSFLVFAVLYVFTNEVSLRAARTVSRRLKRLTAKVKRGRELGEEDFRGLQGWRWGVLELTA